MVIRNLGLLFVAVEACCRILSKPTLKPHVEELHVARRGHEVKMEAVNWIRQQRNDGRSRCQRLIVLMIHMWAVILVL